MFTKIFKSDYIFQFIFLIIIAILIWIKPFLTEDISYTPVNAPLYNIFKWVFEGSVFFKVILSFSLLLFQSLLFKRILSSNDLAQKNSLLPAFIYLLLMSSSADYQNIQPLIFANFLLIIALQTILTTYSKPESYEQIFNATLLISLASMFYFPVIFFILFIWLVFLVFSLLKWREWAISLFGFITPYLILFSYYFLTENFAVRINTYLIYFKEFTFHNPHFTVANIIFMAVISLLFIFSFISILSRLGERSIFYRKKIIVIIMFLIISLISLFFSKEYFVFHLCMLFLPISFFLANYLMQIKKLIYSEILYLILFGTWIYNYLGF